MKTSWFLGASLLVASVFGGMSQGQPQIPAENTQAGRSLPAIVVASPLTQVAPDRGYRDPATPAIPAVHPAAAAPAVAAPSIEPRVGKSYLAAGCCSGTDGCCDGGCGTSGGFPRPALIQKTDSCFDCFISPISNPVFFEDPRNLTEARFIFLNHQVPAAAGGGNVQLYALQLRARLTENVSLIATKDGFVTSSNPLIDDGWADLSAGLKFNLLTDPQAQRLLSTGFTFEMPTGMARTLQRNGDGELNLFLSGGQRNGSNQLLSAAGFRLPMNTTDESQVFYWSNHLSRMVSPRAWILTEFNWYHWLKSGQDGLAGVEGLDLFNLGSTGVAGNDIVTQAVGLKFKPHRATEIGVAYEFPLTERRDVIEDRINVNWIWRY